jgi:uncharacterized protein YrrD
MFTAAKHMYGASLEGADGRAGTLYDVLFDDQSWRVRYLVISTERWFRGRQVLVEPKAVQQAEWPEQRLSVSLTKEQVRRSPRADTDLPVARRRANEAARMLVWEAYWAGLPDVSEKIEGDPHLRSTKVLSGLHIHCSDGLLGHIDDFIVDDETWRVRYLVVETRNWWPGKHVLVELNWIESIRWEDGEVYLTHSREEVLSRPAYDGTVPAEPSMAGSV